MENERAVTSKSVNGQNNLNWTIHWNFATWMQFFLRYFVLFRIHFSAFWNNRALLITHPWYAECANANEKKRQKRKTTRVNFAEGILWNRVKNERRRETQSIQLWRWCGKWIYIIITEVINSTAPQKNVRNLKWTHSVQGRG